MSRVSVSSSYPSSSLYSGQIQTEPLSLSKNPVLPFAAKNLRNSFVGRGFSLAGTVLPATLSAGLPQRPISGGAIDMDTGASVSPTTAIALVGIAIRSRVPAVSFTPTRNSKCCAECPPHALRHTAKRIPASKAIPSAAARRPLRAQGRSVECQSQSHLPNDRPTPCSPANRSPWLGAGVISPPKKIEWETDRLAHRYR